MTEPLKTTPETPAEGPAPDWWDCRTDRPQAVGEWLAAARRGAVLHYHRGFLMIDAHKPATFSARALLFAARALMAAADDGRVRLVQARVPGADGVFDYFAIAAGRPPRAPGWPREQAADFQSAAHGGATAPAQAGSEGEGV